MKVYNVKNMNEWGEMEQKEVNGVVVKVAVIGEQNDLQTGEKTPLCEEVYASIIQNNDNYYIEGNDKEYPFVRVRPKGSNMFIPHGPNFIPMCEEIEEAAKEIPDSIVKSGIEALKSYENSSVSLENTYENTDANIFKYELQKVLKKDRPYCIEFLAYVLITRAEMKKKQEEEAIRKAEIDTLKQPDDPICFNKIDENLNALCELILRNDKHMITQDEFKKQCAVLLNVKMEEVIINKLRTECIRKIWIGMNADA